MATSSKTSSGFYIFLLLLAVAVGGIIFYWNTSGTVPSLFTELFSDKQTRRQPEFLTNATKQEGPVVSSSQLVSSTGEAVTQAETQPHPGATNVPSTENATAGAPTAEPALTDSAVETPPLSAGSATAMPSEIAPETPTGTAPAPAVATHAPTAENTPTPEAPQLPVIILGKGKPVPGGSVKGRIPTAEPVDTTALYGSRENRAATGSSAKGSVQHMPVPTNGPSGEDSIVRLEFTDDMARFLVYNYWPSGTHPSARLRGISTADPKWANIRYGSQLRGFGAPHDNSKASREKVLSYVLTPSMINGLYALYNQRFFAAMSRYATERRIGSAGQERPLTPAEIAEMYAIYTSRAHSLAGTIQAYYNAGEIPARLEKLQAAEQATSNAYIRLMEHMQAAGSDTPPHGEPQRAYQEAVVRREQARENIAAAMRRSGHTRNMDTDTIVYIVSWLHRRGPGASAGIASLAAAFERLAVRMEQEELHWQSMPATQ